MTKKSQVRTALLLILVACTIIFAATVIIKNIDNKNPITANTIFVETNTAIRVPGSNQDLPNIQEGTVILWTKPPVEIFDQFADARDYIIFFSAKNIPGLRVVYNIKEKKFEAGTPIISSGEIDIFDGKSHQLTYTYKKDFEQAIFIDGEKVNSSHFKPLKISDVTGFAVAIATIEQIDIKGAEIDMYDRYFTGNDLKKI